MMKVLIKLIHSQNSYAQMKWPHNHADNTMMNTSLCKKLQILVINWTKKTLKLRKLIDLY